MLNYDAKVLRNELEATEYDDFNISVLITSMAKLLPVKLLKTVQWSRECWCLIWGFTSISDSITATATDCFPIHELSVKASKKLWLLHVIG